MLSLLRSGWYRSTRAYVSGWLISTLTFAAPAAAYDVSYTYDTYGRLETATYREGTTLVATVTYAYDANGNRTSAVMSGASRGTLNLAASSYSGGEASGQRVISVSVQRMGGSIGEASVSYSTADASATASGGDYTAASGTLVWSHGDASAKTFLVTILDDTALESTESFTIALTGASGASLGVPASAVVSIADNDSDLSPPSAPGAPSFSNVTATSATASWDAATDNVAVTGYQYRINTGAWQWVGNATSVGLTGLTCATTYTVAVQARDAAGNWGPSGSNSFTTVDGCAPSAPGTPTFTDVTATSATASWTPATDNVGVTGYQYRINGGGWLWLGNVTSVGLTGLTCGTSYTVSVQARDAMGNWGPVSANSLTTADSCPPGAPGTPTFANVTATSATASWSPATDNVGVTGYQYRLNSGAWQSLGNVTSVGLSGLTCATTYTVAVRARDAAGNWGGASSSSFTTRDGCAPSAPGTPSFSNITFSSATASWSAASDNVGVTGYQYRLNGGSWLANSSTSVALAGLSPGTTYSLDVRALDAAGNAGNPSTATFTTSVQITISSRSIHTQVPGSATAVYVLTNAGDIFTSAATSNTNSDTGDWLTPKSGMGNFQARATPISGTCTGTMNTWLTLSSSLSWAKGIGGPVPQTVSCSFTLQIRATANPTVILGTASISLSARNQ